MRTIYFNADDFGWTDGHNQAVERGHRFGALNRASLLANGLAFEGAVRLAAEMPKLQVGVHLTLNEGRPLSYPSALPVLLNGSLVFPDTLNALMRLWLGGRLSRIEVRREWRAQVEHVLKAGIRPSHLDSHKHVHLIPPLLDVAVQLAGEYEIPYLRLPKESTAGAVFERGLSGAVLWLLAVRAQRIMSRFGLTFASCFIGVGSSGAMTGDRLLAAVRSAPQGITEIMTHPAVVTPSVAGLQQRYRWASAYRFEEELQALCSPQVLALA